MTPGHDELGGEPVTPQILGALRVVHPDGEILMDFKVEMGGVDPVIVSDRTDLLSFVDLLSLADCDLIEVSVERVGELQLFVLNPGMADDDDVAPGGMDVTGEDDQTVSDRVDRLSQAAFAASIGDEPVLTHMAATSEAPGLIIPFAIRGGHREVKAVGGFGDTLGLGRKHPPPKKQEDGSQRQLEWNPGHGRESPRVGKPIGGRNSCVTGTL